MDEEAENEPQSATVAQIHRLGQHADDVFPAAGERDDEPAGDEDEQLYSQPRDPSRWERAGAQVRFWFRTGAIVFLGCFVIGWPVGMSLSAYQQTGMFSLKLGLTLPVLALAVTIAALIFVIGQMLYLTLRMVAKAEELEASAARFTAPEMHAVGNVRSVGQAVRSEITALNGFLDEALIKLASAESMIRQQVQAIDTVGTSLRDDSGNMIDTVARERGQLIELTEAMNAQAEAFAEAIAEKARLGDDTSRAAGERIAEAEAELESRLSRLEATAEKALSAFETLTSAFETRQGSVEKQSADMDRLSHEVVDKSTAMTKHFTENTEAIAKAQAQLREESERLESLIRQQRDRADRLAEAITRQTDRLSSLPADLRQGSPSLKVDKGAERPAPAAPRPAPGPKADPAEGSSDAAGKKPLKLGFASEKDDGGNGDTRPSARPAGGRKALGLTGITGENDPEESPARPARRSSRLSSLGIAGGRGAAETRQTSREERQSTAWRDILAAADTPDRHTTERDTTPSRREPSETEGRARHLPLGLHSPTPAEAARLRGAERSGQERMPVEPSGATPPAGPEGGQEDSDVVWRIRQMQSFMVEVETRLYGRPDPRLLARYKSGERNIFAYCLLQREESLFRERIKTETARNEIFERAVFDFLANFDALLEPEDDVDAADGLIDDYLGSPLGQIYVLIGSALDYFS